MIRLEQPWRVAGRKVATAPASLDAAAVAVVDRLRSRTPLILGGRSAGARSSCRIAHHLGASAVLALSFPLHPPGKPERSRADELASVRVPTLVVQGERDPFGTPGEFPPDQPLVVVPAADHGLKAPKRSGVTPDGRRPDRGRERAGAHRAAPALSAVVGQRRESSARARRCSHVERS